jgi:hypothetical protein
VLEEVMQQSWGLGVGGKRQGHDRHCGRSGFE